VPQWYDAVASPCHLFSHDHDHIVETSRSDHYRAPCGNNWTALLVPTSVGWDDRCVPLSYKRETLPRCCHCQVSPAFELDSVAALVFPLWLVLANPPLAHLHHCFAYSPRKLFHRLCRRPPEEVRRRSKEGPQRHRRPWLNSWRCSCPSIGHLQRCTSASSAEFVFF
jgi:hypothetical protein